MRWILRAIYLLIAVVIIAFFHYTLPQRDIVRIVGTYEERQDFGGISGIFWGAGDAGGGTNAQNRDVLFIQTVMPDGKEMVYRNEDTGWGWPPYFKFDTANLQTKAADGISAKANPEWYAMRHYGWRNVIISAFPNALSLKPVAGPDVVLIPWFNIIFLTVLVLIIWAIWRRLDRWKGRHIDPVIEDVGDTVTESRRGISRWLGTWKRKS